MSNTDLAGTPGHKSWISRFVATTAEMVSFCPAFWEICGIDSADPVAAQKAARLRTKESNTMYFDGEIDAYNEGIKIEEKLMPRKRRTRDDWINARPRATVMHLTDDFEVKPHGTGIFLQSGGIEIVVEKNVLDIDGQPIGNSEMPSEELADEWIDQNSNLIEELLQISLQNRLPRTNKPYPPDRFYIPILAARLGMSPQFSSLENNKVYGPHFMSTILLQYGVR